MGLLTSIAAGIFGLIGAVMVALLKDEAMSYMPKLIRLILSSAVRRVPEAKRERYAEEWEAHVAEYPGKLTQIFQALRCLAAGMNHEEFDVAFLRAKTRNFMIIGGALALMNDIANRFTGYNFWIDHAIGLATFYLTALFVWASYWVIRLKPHMVNRIDRKGGDA